MVMVRKLRKLAVCATRADQLLDPGVAMDKRDNLGKGRFLDLLTVHEIANRNKRYGGSAEAPRERE